MLRRFRHLPPFPHEKEIPLMPPLQKLKLERWLNRLELL